MHTACNEKPSFLQLGAHFPPFVRLCWIPTLPHTHTHAPRNIRLPFTCKIKSRKKSWKKVMFVFASVFFFIRITLWFGYSLLFCALPVLYPKWRPHTCIHTNARCFVCVCVFCSFHLFSFACRLRSLSPSLFPPSLGERQPALFSELPRRQMKK